MFSYGSCHSPPTLLLQAGIPVVTSAGNEYVGDACAQSPAAVPDAIVVASIDDTDSISAFSNVGSCT